MAKKPVIKPDDLRAFIEEDIKNRETECAKKLTAVLLEFNCRVVLMGFTQPQENLFSPVISVKANPLPILEAKKE